MINTLDNSTVITFTTTSDQSSSVFAVPARASQIAWQLIGSPDAIELQLLGSINNVTDEFTVIDSSTSSIGELRYVSPSGFRFIKIRQVSRTGVAAVNIHFNIIQNGLAPSVVGVPVSAGANKVLFDNGDVQVWSDSPSFKRLHLTDYLNFSGDGSSGYGIRNNAGTIEAKNSGGAWAALGSGGSVTIPGDDTQLLFNDGGALGANAGLTFTKATGVLSITALAPISDETGQLGTFTKRFDQGAIYALDTNRVFLHADNADWQTGFTGQILTMDATGAMYVGDGVFPLLLESTTSTPVIIEGVGGLRLNGSLGFTSDTTLTRGSTAGFLILDGATPAFIISDDGYLNFGATGGSAGYGLRDNAGTIEIKNDGGSWSSIGGIAGLNYASNTLTLGAAPANQIIQPIAAVSPDQSGVNLILRGGLKTGTGDNGQIHLQTPDEIDSLIIDRFGWANVSIGIAAPEIDITNSLYLFGGADNAFFSLDGTAHQLNLTFTGGGAVNGLVLDAPIQASGYKSSDASPGVDAGPYTIITSITVKNGLITAIAGS
jgi:hypothetical protein